jgi:hypothetical protein
MEKVIIEIVNENGKYNYSVQKSNNPQLDNLASIAVQAVGTYLQYGNNPKGMVSQLMPMMQKMMMGSMNGGMGGMPPIM